MENLIHKYIVLPSIKREKRLPVVMSKREVRVLLKTPHLIKHRLVLAILYGCGLRCFELRNIRISDLDFYRRVLHVRQGKGKKDRYVPLSKYLIIELKKYISKEKPKNMAF